jgi:hypothetical protein
VKVHFKDIIMRCFKACMAQLVDPFQPLRTSLKVKICNHNNIKQKMLSILKTAGMTDRKIPIHPYFGVY